MFDIGFWELLMIGVIALLVIGPERLPRVARTAGLWVGRMKRFVAGVKADIDHELRAEELKRLMAKHAEDSGVHEIIEETRSAVDDLEKSTREARQELESGGDKTTPADKPNDKPASDNKS